MPRPMGIWRIMIKSARRETQTFQPIPVTRCVTFFLCFANLTCYNTGPVHTAPNSSTMQSRCRSCRSRSSNRRRRRAPRWRPPPTSTQSASATGESGYESGLKPGRFIDFFKPATPSKVNKNKVSPW